ncbi:serine/threonine-protein kinase, partial [Egicoccus sp. AB-alg6-2]|uniref:serine/threonine-protein kinase n=1 Tax=Egicoccus sp. AB-alg6-2 TaxID=3242692 RepID=UPI00359D4A1F
LYARTLTGAAPDAASAYGRHRPMAHRAMRAYPTGVTDVDETTTRHRLDDRYVLLDQLGAGGAGVVWRAHDEVLDRTVAVKLLHRELARDEETAARFRAEAAAAAKLTHPHAVIVYDIGHTDGCDYLVMELVEGGTLGDVLDQGRLPPGVAAAVGAQIARALGSAHGRGLVHRDVKPANVLVTRDGVAKVADFGIARALGDATSRLTTPGQVLGTARYLAPEQLRDQAIDARADVYALGLMLHQAVTGRLPFGEGTASEVAARRLVADGLPRASDVAPGVPVALDDVIARATALDPDDRHVDGAALAAALGPLAAPQAATELAARIRRVRRVPSDATPPLGSSAMSSPAAAARPSSDRAVGATAGGRAGPGGARPEDGGEPTVAVGSMATAPGAAGATAHGTDDRGASRGPWLPWAAALLVLVLGLWFVWPGTPGDESAEPGDGQTEDAEPEPDEVAPITVVDAGDHDPLGGGSENPDLVGNAIDDDPATAWQTVGYDNNPALGGLKEGVGLWLDLGQRREVGTVVVTTAHPGYDMTVYVGDEPPSGGQPPEEWGEEVGAVGDADEQDTIVLAEGTEARTVLLWFTSLGPDGGRFRGSVAHVEVHGWETR